MHAAVDHVQHRDGQRSRRVAAEVAVERDARLRRRGLRRRERDPEDRVRAEPALVRRAVGVDQRGVERGLVGRVETDDGLAERVVHVGDRLGHALAAPRRAAVAQLDRLVHARRGARRDDRRAARAGLEPDVDLDGRVPARVEHLPPAHFGDPASYASPSRGRSSDPAARERSERPVLAGRGREPLGFLDPGAEAPGGSPQLELRVDVQPPRDVDARRTARRRARRRPGDRARPRRPAPDGSSARSSRSSSSRSPSAPATSG